LETHKKSFQPFSNYSYGFPTICHYGRESQTPPDQLGQLEQLSGRLIGGNACMADEETGYETYEQSVEWTPWHPPAWLPLDNIRKPKEYWEIIAYTKIPIVFLMISNYFQSI
jgi:hypothetical protein